jgi:hypothetical protein
VIHLTLTTGHVRTSPRSEVADDVIAALAPLLRTGTHNLPQPPGYRLRVTIEDSTLIATLLGDQDSPLVTVLVAPDPAAIGAVRALHSRAELFTELEPPMCVDEIHDAIALDPDAALWTGDLTRCIAWAWIELRRGAS